MGETVGETVGPGIVDSMLLYNAHPDYTKCNNITIDAQTIDTQTNMAFYPIEPIVPYAAPDTDVCYAQQAGFAMLDRTITDYTLFTGDQCQSFVASLCSDPVKLI